MNLGTLLFEDDPGFPGGKFFFADGPCNVAERSRLGDGAELPERALAVFVSVGAGSGADERLFRGHAVLRGVFGVFGPVRKQRRRRKRRKRREWFS